MQVEKRRALICGISGQDGAYLARLLLSKGYEVWGTSREAEVTKFENLNALNILKKVKTCSMKPEIFNNVLEVFSAIRPHEIYNLAGQSSVGLSFEKPLETMTSIATSTLNQLEAIRQIDRSMRFFSASSSECFGNTGECAANEKTAFHPESPYGVAKATATWYVSVYRKSYDLFACSGILFNHESPMRSERFVTMKIVSTVKRIAAGSNEKLVLGDLEIKRDWGWAEEYVDAMWRMLNHKVPDDFIIATGSTQTLKQFVKIIFEQVGLDWLEHVVSDPKLKRLSDPKESRGNPEKAYKVLGWEAKIKEIEVPKMLMSQKLK